ncbi:MAG: hypothetical protein FJ288_13525 [Planctomycetes bacterium]|nr:hypothetical protein [Planctomycetota bacterium]
MKHNIFDEYRARQWSDRALGALNSVMERAYGDFVARQNTASLYSDEVFDLADGIFPEKRPGLRFDLESEMAQTASVLAIVDTGRRLVAEGGNLLPALGIIQGEAMMISGLQGVIEDPLGMAFGGAEFPRELRLPDPHHRLAEYAASIAAIVENMKAALVCGYDEGRRGSYSDAPPYGPPRLCLARLGVRLGSTLLAMYAHWLQRDLRLGMRVRFPRYWQALRAGLRSKMGSAKGIRKRKEHAADVRRQRHLDERDRTLAKEIHETWESLRKKRRGRSVPLSEALGAVRAAHVERLIPVLRQRHPAYDDRAIRRKAEEGLSLSLLRQAYAKHYGSPKRR